MDERTTCVKSYQTLIIKTYIRIAENLKKQHFTWIPDVVK